VSYSSRTAELCTLAESSAFAARVQIASSPAVFKQALNHEASFRELLLELKMNSAAQEELTKHTMELAQQPIDERYANPLDVAMAAYLYALSEASSDWAKLAAASAARAPQTWWARLAAFELLGPTSLSSSVSTNITALSVRTSLRLGVQNARSAAAHALGSFGDIKKATLTKDGLFSPRERIGVTTLEPFVVTVNGAANPTWSLSTSSTHQVT
jgi:hypothetical protein